MNQHKRLSFSTNPGRITPQSSGSASIWNQNGDWVQDVGHGPEPFGAELSVTDGTLIIVEGDSNFDTDNNNSLGDRWNEYLESSPIFASLSLDIENPARSGSRLTGTPTASLNLDDAGRRATNAAYIANHSGDVVIVCNVGTNDCNPGGGNLQEADVPAWIAGYEAEADYYKGLSTPTQRVRYIACTIPDRYNGQAAVAAINTQLLASTKFDCIIDLALVLSDWEDEATYSFSDGVHYNTLGSYLVYKEITSKLFPTVPEASSPSILYRDPVHERTTANAPEYADYYGAEDALHQTGDLWWDGTELKRFQAQADLTLGTVQTLDGSVRIVSQTSNAIDTVDITANVNPNDPEETEFFLNLRTDNVLGDRMNYITSTGDAGDGGQTEFCVRNVQGANLVISNANGAESSYPSSAAADYVGTLPFHGIVVDDTAGVPTWTFYPGL